MIEVNHLTKKYGAHLALNDLSFTVEKGKIYGMLGPNGAGKSTCMNIMTGYIAATSGEVKINGYDIVKEAEEAKKNIGYLPEIPPLYPDMKVWEYLEFVAELKKVKKEERRKEIEDVMQKTFISDMRNKLIKNLSKGYKQRVGLAQAMLGKPSIIILDEPTVGLDPKQILEIRELILSLKKEHTVILSSHILSEVSAVCDEIMIISKGKMAACDTPEGLRNLMQGEDTLELTVKGNRAELENALSSIRGISSYQIIEERDVSESVGIRVEEEKRLSKSAVIEITEEKESLVSVSLRVEAGKEIRETLFYLLAEKHMPIFRMEMSSKSLEDIFLELTSSEGGDKEASENQENKEAE